MGNWSNFWMLECWKGDCIYAASACRRGHASLLKRWLGVLTRWLCCNFSVLRRWFWSCWQRKTCRAQGVAWERSTTLMAWDMVVVVLAGWRWDVVPSQYVDVLLGALGHSYSDQEWVECSWERECTFVKNDIASLVHFDILLHSLPLQWYARFSGRSISLAWAQLWRWQELTNVSCISKWT